jgi:hypothetical protein
MPNLDDELSGQVAQLPGIRSSPGLVSIELEEI